MLSPPTLETSARHDIAVGTSLGLWLATMRRRLGRATINACARQS